MALLNVHGIEVAGVAACVPAAMESNMEYDWISEEERRLLVKTTGVLNRRVSEKNVIASDLCYEAALRLLTEANVAPADVDIIVFVSQSKDYMLPCSATILQHRLGLPKIALAFDVPLGCSGYVYGLSIVASMMSNSDIKNGLLLAGDISSLSINKRDKSTYPLFGDAGSATLLRRKGGARMDFNLQTDGSNFEAIIIPHGNSRRPADDESAVEVELDKGVIRSKKNLWLNGFDIFNFSVKEVPPNVNELLSHAGVAASEPDYFIMHQANLLLNETIRKKLKFPAEKVPYSLRDYGNTSSASIPLTMVANLKNELASGKKKLLLSGFGVGLSWGSAVLDTDHLIIPNTIEI